MKPTEFFRHCPRCGAPSAVAGVNPFRCGACGLLYFLNPAVAVGGFLHDGDGRVLFLRRAKEPARGRLGLPGGFIDFGETAEAALRREVREEVELEIGRARFLCSQPNEYVYDGVTYPVLDLFFVAAVNGAGTTASPEEVAALYWRKPVEIRPEEIAFSSVRAALKVYLAG